MFANSFVTFWLLYCTNLNQKWTSHTSENTTGIVVVVFVFIQMSLLELIKKAKEKTRRFMPEASINSGNVLLVCSFDVMARVVACVPVRKLRRRAVRFVQKYDYQKKPEREDIIDDHIAHGLRKSRN